MLTFLIDECVSKQTKILIEQLGFNIESLMNLGLKGAKDKEIFDAANKNKMVLVTNDKGFGDIRRYQPSSHNGVIIIKAYDLRSLSNCHSVLNVLMATEREFKGTLFIVNEKKYRKRKKP